MCQKAVVEKCPILGGKKHRKPSGATWRMNRDVKSRNRGKVENFKLKLNKPEIEIILSPL